MKYTAQLIALFLCFTTYESNAQLAYNPNLLPLGEKEMLMGNTGTGGIQSAAAAYYNPAALTMLKGNTFSLSASAYARYKFKADPIGQVNGTNLVYEGGDFASIPTSLISTKLMGKYTVALSILIPLHFAYEGQTTYRVPVDDDVLRLKVRQNYKERNFVVGFSAARKLNESWSVGATLSGQMYSNLSSTDVSVAYEINPQPFSQSSSRLKMAPVGITLAAGIQKSTGRWNLGLKLTTESITVYKSGEYYELNYNLLPDGQSFRNEVDEENLDGEFKVPFEARFGAVYAASDQLNLACDISWSGKNSFSTFEGKDFTENIKTKSSFRLSMGLEINADDKTALYAGGALIPSQLDPTAFNDPVNFWSVQGGVKRSNEHLESIIGFFYSEGNGDLTLGGGITGTQTFNLVGLILGTNYKF